MYNSSEVENTDDTDSQLKSAAGGPGGSGGWWLGVRQRQNKAGSH